MGGGWQRARRIAATLGPLRPVQVVDRGLRPLRRARAAQDPRLGALPLRRRGPAPSAGAGHGVVADGAFHFAGLTRRLQDPDGWDPAGVPRLWIYTLHYFQWLHALPRDVALLHVLDWIDRNPPGRGPGWEPYPIALRLREWIEWLCADPAPGGVHRERILASLARQADALDRQVEHHLQGNHLLEDAIGLCWAGLSLEGPAAEQWLRHGLALLRREVLRQVLHDGTHEERTPGYQARLADALLRLREVARLVGGRAGEGVASIAAAGGAAMAHALGWLAHPDGDVAGFGDTALTLDPTVGQLAARFGLEPIPSLTTPGPWELPYGRFLGWRDSGEDYLAFDVGGVGPPHQPGHGHAGALSFELSRRGERLVTDTGVATYEPGAVRAYDRSTAAHGTVEIDGANQSDVWAAFRCGRRIEPLAPRSHVHGDVAVLQGGYAHGGPSGRTRHLRRVEISPAGMTVTDLVRAPGRHVATSRLPLAPDVDVRPDGDAWWLLRDGRPQARLESEGVAFAVTCTPYHPTFGVEVERVTLRAEEEFRDRWAHRWRLVFV